MNSHTIETLAYEIAAKEVLWPSLPILMVRLRDSKIVYSTASLAATFGYEVAELIGQRLDILLPPDVREQHARWLRDESIPKVRLVAVARHLQGIRKSGEVFPVHIGLTAIQVQDEAIGVALVVDLTSVLRAVDPGHTWTTPREWPPKSEKVPTSTKQTT